MRFKGEFKSYLGVNYCQIKRQISYINTYFKSVLSFTRRFSLSPLLLLYNTTRAQQPERERKKGAKIRMHLKR